MVNEYDRSQSPTTMKQKRQSCGSCIPACFSSPSTSTSTSHPFSVLQNEDNNGRARLPMPEIKDKCRHLISKLGGVGGGWTGRPGRRRHSADYSYDASSYALNFEDDSIDSRTDELLLRGFSALPPPQDGKSNASSASTAHHLDENLEKESGRGWNRRPWPEKKGTSHNLLARIEGRGGPRPRSSSTDFSYDPSSYARNFQDENSDELSGFSVRFQPPTPSAKCSTLRPEVVAFS